MNNLNYIFELSQLCESKMFFEKYGFFVIKNILSSEEIVTSDNLFWKDITTLNKNIDRYDRNTWSNKTFPGEFSTGIVGYYGMCQSDFTWNIRTNTNIQSIFSHLHGTTNDNLCCSMDCINIMFSKKNKKKSWLHRDQVPWLENGNTLSIQGCYNRYSVGEEDSGFICVPQTHKNTIPYFSNYRQHYLPLSESDPLHQESIKLITPENSILIWDSKLIHANKVGKRDRPNDINNLPQLNRLCVYVSYSPKQWRNPIILEEKKKLYYKGQGTSHWSNLAKKKKLKPRWPRNPKSDELHFLKPTLDDNKNIPSIRLSLL